MLTETGFRPLVVDEYTIAPFVNPETFVATLAIRYTRDTYAHALAVAHAFLRKRYGAIVFTGHSGSINGDSLKVYFWAVHPVATQVQDDDV